MGETLNESRDLMSEDGRGLPAGFYIGIMGAAAIGFAVICYAVVTGKAAGFDDPVREFFYGLRCPGLDAAVTAFTHTGDAAVIIAMCVVLLIWNKSRVPYGVAASACALGVTIINEILRRIVCRPRPADITPLVSEDSFSFASGHSATTIIFYGILIYLVRKDFTNRTAANVITVVLTAVIVLMGPSRIYAGAHFPTDLLAGWCMGVFCLCLAVLVLRSLRHLRKLRRS